MVMSDSEIRACKTIASHFGKPSQSLKLIEELSELIHEVSVLSGLSFSDRSRTVIHNNLVEEIADVYIMLEQFKFLYDIPDEFVSYCIDYKLDRTLKRYDIK